jgi:hypothetical protein
MARLLIGAACGAVLTLAGVYLWLTWYFKNTWPG